MADQLTDNQIYEFKEAFSLFDKEGDGKWRKLYHPINQYVVHLDMESSHDEWLDLYSYVANDTTFRKFRNFQMITKANLVTYRDLMMAMNTLHVIAVLLKEGGEDTEGQFASIASNPNIWNVVLQNQELWGFLQ